MEYEESDCHQIDETTPLSKAKKASIHSPLYMEIPLQVEINVDINGVSRSKKKKKKKLRVLSTASWCHC